MIGSYEAQQRERAKEIRARLFSIKKPTIKALSDKQNSPEWKRTVCWFYSHVDAFHKEMSFRRQVVEFSTNNKFTIEASEEKHDRRSMLEITREVLSRHEGVSLADIRSHKRQRYITKARHDVIRSIFAERADLTSPVVGRFLNRDHTSILSAAGKLARKPSTWVDK